MAVRMRLQRQLSMVATDMAVRRADVTTGLVSSLYSPFGREGWRHQLHDVSATGREI